VEATKPGEILVLENIRFDPREEQNKPQFSAELAKLADAYVDDAFGAIHRAHASTVGVAKLLPSYAGRLVEREVSHLEYLNTKPEHPFVVILGGAKPDDKIALIQNLLGRVDRFLVAGGIANTILKVQGTDIKESLVGDDKALAIAKKLLSDLGDKLVLPIDYIWEGQSIMDVGEKTTDIFEKQILHAKTIFWNGTLGVAEEKRFAKGTRAIAVAIASSPAKSVVGGGDTVAAIDQYKLRKHISFVSTGGGATLEFLAGKSLPGLEVLGYGQNP
jgi:phosphoglycerate kinase